MVGQGSTTEGQQCYPVASATQSIVGEHREKCVPQTTQPLQIFNSTRILLAVSGNLECKHPWRVWSLIHWCSFSWL